MTTTIVRKVQLFTKDERMKQPIFNDVVNYSCRDQTLSGIIYKTIDSIGSLEKQINNLMNRQLEEFEKDNNEVQDMNATIENNHTEMINLHHTFMDHLDRIVNVVSELQNNITDIENNCEENTHKIEDEFDAYADAMLIFKKLLENLTTEISQFKNQHDEDLYTIRAKIQEMKQDYDECVNLKEYLEGFQNVIEDIEQNYNNMDNCIDNIVDDIDKFEEDVHISFVDVKERLHDNENHLSETAAEVEMIHSDMDEIVDDLFVIHADFDNLTKENNYLKNELSKQKDINIYLESKVDDLSEKLKNLVNRVENIQKNSIIIDDEEWTSMKN